MGDDTTLHLGHFNKTLIIQSLQRQGTDGQIGEVDLILEMEFIPIHQRLLLLSLVKFIVVEVVTGLRRLCLDSLL